MLLLQLLFCAHLIGCATPSRGSAQQHAVANAVKHAWKGYRILVLEYCSVATAVFFHVAGCLLPIARRRRGCWQLRSADGHTDAHKCRAPGANLRPGSERSDLVTKQQLVGL